MITYIKKDVEGYYAEFAYPLSKKNYDNIGTTWEDYLEGKWVRLSDEQIAVRDNYPFATVKEVFFMRLNEEEVKQRSLEDVRFSKENEAISFDRSFMVNQFFINDIPVWFYKNERASLIMRFNAEKQNGEKTTKIWYNDNEFIFPIDTAIKIIYAVEIYASKCYDKTKEHLLNIKKLNTEEEIRNYNVTVGYPEKLRF